jgi:hypothetical protein
MPVRSIWRCRARQVLALDPFGLPTRLVRHLAAQIQRVLGALTHRPSSTGRLAREVGPHVVDWQLSVFTHCALQPRRWAVLGDCPAPPVGVRDVHWRCA